MTAILRVKASDGFFKGWQVSSLEDNVRAHDSCTKKKKIVAGRYHGAEAWCGVACASKARTIFHFSVHLEHKGMRSKHSDVDPAGAKD